MDSEIKHQNKSDTLQSSNNPMNQHECFNTSISHVNNLTEPFYCTINEFIKVCRRYRRTTIKRHVKQEIIEARRVRCPHGRGYRYEIAIYNSVVKEKVLKVRQEKEQMKRIIQEKRQIVKLKKTIKNLYVDINENNIKEHIISLL
ncbi:MAG: hypothetical protein ABFD82_19970 [Syntrophaceae bacterium]